MKAKEDAGSTQFEPVCFDSQSWKMVSWPVETYWVLLPGTGCEDCRRRISGCGKDEIDESCGVKMTSSVAVSRLTWDRELSGCLIRRVLVGSRGSRGEGRAAKWCSRSLDRVVLQSEDRLKDWSCKESAPLFPPSWQKLA